MRLPDRIKIQKATLTQDAAGQPVQSWTTYRVCWAKLRDVSASELGRDPIEGLVRTSFTIRYPHAGLIPEPVHRVVMGEGEISRTWNIEGVQRRDDDRRMLELVAAEVQDG